RAPARRRRRRGPAPPRAPPLAGGRCPRGREEPRALPGLHPGLAGLVELREAVLRQATKRLGQRSDGLLSGEREARGRPAYRAERLPPQRRGHVPVLDARRSGGGLRRHQQRLRAAVPRRPRDRSDPLRRKAGPDPHPERDTVMKTLRIGFLLPRTSLHSRNYMCLVMRALAAAGVATPATYVASHAEELAPLLDAGALVLKPHQGGGGYGVRIVRSAGELAEVPYDRHAPVFAQRYHAPQGRDRKIYAIGGRLFGVKKVFPCGTEAEKHGEPFARTPELRDIALRCGGAFGIDLYGVDIVESEGTSYVVDVCSIPGFKGVPDAPRVLAEYFYRAAERATRGDLVAQAAP